MAANKQRPGGDAVEMTDIGLSVDGQLRICQATGAVQETDSWTVNGPMRRLSGRVHGGCVFAWVHCPSVRHFVFIYLLLAKREKMEFREQKDGESLVDHLLANAGALVLCRMDVARLRNASSLQRGSKKEQTRANDVARDIQRRLQRSVDDEIVRGGKIEVFNDAGAIRLVDRDGLQALYTSGALTGMTKAELDAQPAKAATAWSLAGVRREAGLVARGLAECRSGDLRSQLGGEGSGGGRGNTDRIVMTKLALAHDVRLLGELERQLPDLARRVLERVAERGEPLAVKGTSGGIRRRDTAALLVALDAAAAIFGLLTG